MTDTKIELISEQNKLIKYLYVLLSNLELEIKKQEALKTKESNQLKTEKKLNHMEYVYKEMILRFLKESSKTEEGKESANIEDQNNLLKSKEEYINTKMEVVSKLEDREKYLKNYDEINFDSVYSYEYVKSEKKTEGFLSFVIFNIKY